MENMPIGIRHHFHKMIIVILLLPLSVADCSQCMTTGSMLSQQSMVHTFVSSASYQEHDPISIQGNAEFASLASSESWPGNGSESNPYCIHGLNITEEPGAGYPFRISDTTVFFILNGSLLVGGIAAIRLSNVTNARINGSLVKDSSQHGIMIDYCHSISLNKNVIKSSQGRGIYLYRAEDMLVENCDIHSCKDRGILIDYTETSIVRNCSIHENSRDGMHLRDSNSNIIQENSIFENGHMGITLGNADECNISGNSIFNNSVSGMDIGDSFGSNIIDNVLHNHIGAGLHISGGSDNATVNNNTFYRNTAFALRTHSNNGLFSMNNFIENANASPVNDRAQASDVGVNNHFVSNFWDEWVFPDENSDGIVDNSYDMYENMDPSPKVKAYHTNRMHILTKPWLVNPNYTTEGYFFYGELNISWTPASDTFDHEITYSLHYLNNKTSEWTNIATGLAITSYLWNTVAVQQNVSYRIRVQSHCENNLEKTSPEGPFLHITEHTLSPPTVLHPNGGEIISNEFEMRWKEARDSWNYSVTYNVWISSDEGDTWFQIVEGLEKTAYVISESHFVEANTNLVKVVAYSEENLKSEDVCDGPFRVRGINTMVYTVLGSMGLIGIAAALIILLFRRFR